ncbi:SusE domain-containing protein [Hymenobacter daeguensis]
MKNLLTQAAAVAFAVLALASCKKDENQASVSPSAPLTLSTATNTVVLAQINDPQTALTYSWNAVQFSISGTEYTKAPAVTYQLQVAKSADGFGYPAIIDAATSTSKAVTVADLNNALNSIGFPTGAPTPAYVRVAAVVGTDNHTFVSAPVAITATAYPACLPPNTDTWALVGPAGNGWPSGTPATEDGIPLVWNCALQAYTARTQLSAGALKFRQNKKWDVNLGGPSSNLATGVALTRNGSDITLATAGTYTVKLVVAGTGAGVTGGTLTITP